MIIRINGKIVEKPLELVDFEPFLPKNKQEMKKFKKLSTWLWSVSGVMLGNSHAFAASSQSMWTQMQPLWAVFQDLAMTIGGIAIFVGILTFYFKRSLGKQVIMSAVLAIAGCFLVPSLIMLVAIIGQTMNHVLVDVFSNMNIQNSVKVGG
jgi:hypothetical protein